MQERVARTRLSPSAIGLSLPFTLLRPCQAFECSEAIQHFGCLARCRCIGQAQGVADLKQLVDRAKFALADFPAQADVQKKPRERVTFWIGESMELIPPVGPSAVGIQELENPIRSAGRSGAGWDLRWWGSSRL